MNAATLATKYLYPFSGFVRGLLLSSSRLPSTIYIWVLMRQNDSNNESSTHHEVTVCLPILHLSGTGRMGTDRFEVLLRNEHH